MLRIFLLSIVLAFSVFFKFDTHTASAQTQSPASGTTASVCKCGNTTTRTLCATDDDCTRQGGMAGCENHPQDGQCVLVPSGGSGEVPGGTVGGTGQLPGSSNTNTGGAPSTEGIVQITNPLENICPKGTTGQSCVQRIIGNVIKTAIGLSGSIALLMFIWGGFLWLTSAGNSDRIEKGRNTMLWAACGLALMFAAYSITSFLITKIAG